MNVDNNEPPDNLKVFVARCWARAALWSIGEFDLHDAVDELEAYRKKLKLDADKAQLIIGRAFAALRCDLGGWKP